LGQLAARSRAADEVLYAPSRNLAEYTFGYREFVADTLWLKLVQHFGHCGSAYLNPNYKKLIKKKESGLNTLDRLFEEEKIISRCHLGWSYQTLDVLTYLAPKFRAAYFHGGMALSVVADDMSGATEKLRKAVIQYPNDWRLLYLTGYHLLVEERKMKEGARYLKKAVEIGAPKFLAAIVARIQTKFGQAVLAKSVLETAIRSTSNPAFKQRLKDRLKEVNKIISNQK